MAGFILILLLIGAAVWIARKVASKTKSGSIGSGFGVSMNKNEIDLERQSNDEVMKIVEGRIVKSGFFIPEKIPELMAGLKSGAIPFGRVNTQVAFDGDTLLTVEEKKALGLNTRMKYSKKLISYFDPKSFKTIEPKSTLEQMQLEAFHRVSRKKELLKLKQMGWVKQVKICSMGGGSDCSKIRKSKKVYNINEVPELPLEGCNAAFCSCSYEAVIPKR